MAIADLELIDGLRSRDERAFDMLVEDYLPRIRRWVRASVDDPAEIDDVVQDVLLAVWRAAPALREDSVLAPWLKAITTNACRKRVRTLARRPAMPVGVLPDRPSETADPVDRITLEAALARMPHREAGILKMLYADDLPLPEAARRLAVSSEAAKSLAARARRRFRSSFRAWYQGMAGFAVLPVRRLLAVLEPLAPVGGAPAAGVVAAATTVAIVFAGSGAGVSPSRAPVGGSVAGHTAFASVRAASSPAGTAQRRMLAPWMSPETFTARAGRSAGVVLTGEPQTADVKSSDATPSAADPGPKDAGSTKGSDGEKSKSPAGGGSGEKTSGSGASPGGSPTSGDTKHGDTKQSKPKHGDTKSSTNNGDTKQTTSKAGKASGSFSSSSSNGGSIASNSSSNGKTTGKSKGGGAHGGAPKSKGGGGKAK